MRAMHTLGTLHWARFIDGVQSGLPCFQRLLLYASTKVRTGGEHQMYHNSPQTWRAQHSATNSATSLDFKGHLLVVLRRTPRDKHICSSSSQSITQEPSIHALPASTQLLHWPPASACVPSSSHTAPLQATLPTHTPVIYTHRHAGASTHACSHTLMTPALCQPSSA
jgi:hypothetical protein